MSDQLAFLIENLPHLLIGFPNHRPGGLLLSVFLALVAIGFGFLIALPMGSGSDSGLWPLRWLCRLYIELFRGLPLILLLILVHQMGGRLRLGIDFTPRTSAIIALTLYSSAYQAELVRAGLQLVPYQLVETAQSMGSTSWQAFCFVKLPYALRVMLPAFTGEAISLFKDTSVVVIIGVAELMTVARMVLGGDVSNAPYWVGMYLTVGLLYFGVAFTLSQLAERWERRTKMGDLVHSLANS